MEPVEIVSVEDSGYYHSTSMSGSTVKVTLQRGNEFVSCEGIVIWDPEEDDEILGYVFDEWVTCFNEGDVGYSYWTE